MDFIWVLGNSGAGKSSLVKSLGNILRCDILEVGEILRSLYKPERIIAADISQSEIITLVNERIVQMSTNLMIVDNFPTNKIQVDLWLKKHSMPIIIFILEIDDTRIRKIGRGRIDDTYSGYIMRKLKFQTETIPIIEYLSQYVSIIKLDATKSPEELVKESLDQFLWQFSRI